MLMNSRDGVDLEIFSPLDWSYVIRGLPCPALPLFPSVYSEALRSSYCVVSL